MNVPVLRVSEAKRGAKVGSARRSASRRGCIASAFTHSSGKFGYFRRADCRASNASLKAALRRDRNRAISMTSTIAISSKGSDLRRFRSISFFVAASIGGDHVVDVTSTLKVAGSPLR
jgi:hypothetical protein